MNTRKSQFLTTAGSLLLILCQTACVSAPVAANASEVSSLTTVSPKRVLFIGNSYLYYNDSLHNHVLRMAKETSPDESTTFRYKSATIGGALLSHHPVDTLLEPGRLGVNEPFDLVILQGGSGEALNPESRATFREAAISMSKKIRASGAEVALYMTHAYVEPHALYDPDMTDLVRRTYVSLGTEINALVIPVGLAFQRAYTRRPDIQLHKSFDGSHPSLLGTYLAACVVYRSLYGKLATDMNYDYFGTVEKEDAEFLRAIADETVNDFSSGE